MDHKPIMTPHLFDAPLPMGQLAMWDLPEHKPDRPSPNDPMLTKAVIEVEGVVLEEQRLGTLRVKRWEARLGDRVVHLDQQMVPVMRWSEASPKAERVSGAYIAGPSVDVRFDGEIIGVASSMTNAVRLARAERDVREPHLPVQEPAGPPAAPQGRLLGSG